MRVLRFGFVGLLIVSISLSSYFSLYVQGATYTFVQTSWNGGATVNVADHNSDQTGWTEYTSKDTNVTANTDVTLTPNSYGFTDDGTTSVSPAGGPTTSGGDFDSGTNSTTSITGSGTGASVRIDPIVTQVNAWDTALKSVSASIDYGSNMIRNGADDTIYVTQGGITTGFYKYTISTNIWTALAVVPGAIGYGSKMIRNGSDDDIYVTRGENTTSFYKYTISTDTWTTLAVAPAALSLGSSMIRNGSDDTIYVKRGNGTTGFYKYTISTDTWTTLAVAPAALSAGSPMIRNGSDDTIYVTQGGNGTGFYKYTISTDTWTTLAVAPAALSWASVTIRNGSEDTIYVTNGGSSTGFYKYTISTNTWTTLAAAPGTIYWGSNMIRNGADDTIYVTQGNSATGFYKYTISTNTWTTLAVVAGAIGDGSSMIRNGADDTIYVTQGNSTAGFFKYSISGNSWTGSTTSNLAVVPGVVSTGGMMIRNGSENDMYVLHGGNSTGFSRYSISGNSWTSLTAVPQAVDAGGYMIRNGSDDDIYVLRGSTSSAFFKYSISGNSWTTMAQAPGPFHLGSTMLRNGSDNDIYVIQGVGTGFYKYSISGNSWTTLAVVPGTFVGGTMIRNGSDNDIYVLQGNFSTGFYKYSISGNSWTTLTAVPAAVYNISTMLRNGSDNDIYVLQGNFSTGFYKYSISGNSWTTLTAVPAGVYGGAMIRNASDNDIYVLRGNNNTGFYKYSISGNSWTTMASTPGATGTGATMIRNASDNDIYITRGNGTTGFYKFIIQTITYPSSGTFTSNPIDLGAQISSFSTLTWTETLNSQTITLKARSSATLDFSGAPAFSTCTNITSGNALSTGGCVTDGHRYIQYEATLSTGNSVVTPTLDSVTLNYSQYIQGTLTSSPYNSTSAGNLVSKLNWSDSGTETVQFQIRSASTSGGLSSAAWCGYEDCSGSTYFDAAEKNVALDSGHPLLNGGDDQYVQYKLILSSGGGSTPTLSDVTVQYVVNAAPEYDTAFGTNGITVSQISDSGDPNWGKVKIDYRVRDIDTDDGSSTPGFVTPSFQYDSGAGFTTILSGSLSANALTNKAVDDVDYNTYTVYWDAMTDIPDTYDGTLQVKVTVSDNEPANNTATATDSIAFDSKDPVLGGVPLIVDASTTPSTLTLSATDDSSFEMRIGLLPDTTDGTYVAYNASATKALATNPDTVYVQFRDIYGNESAVTSASSTETPSLVMVQDISNVSTSEYRLFTSWRAVEEPANGFADYKLYRSDDNITYSLLTTISSRSVNFFIDDTVLFDTTYYYKVKMTDDLGNVSWFSSTLTGKANGAQDAGEGGGGSETTPPIISNVSSSAISTTQATITWDTDELSDSTVGFSTTEGVFIDEIGMASFADTAAGSGQHTVVLTGLSPSTTYYYQVKSSDPSGNEEIDNNGGDGYTFTTTPGPAISGVALESASNTQATIVWNTDIDSSTAVFYSTSVSNGALVSPTEVGSGTLTSSHSQTITSLTTGTLYYFSVKSVDGSSNIATDNNGGNFYQFTTTTDSTGPVISTIDDSVTTADKAVITWLTDEQANSQVRYALVSGGPYTATPATANYSEDHYTILTDLVSDTTYYYKVVSSDLSGNQTVSDESSFITLQGTEFQHDPLSSLTDVSAPLVTNANAIIAATTDQPAICTVEYGTTPGSYGATPESETLLNQEHSIRLSSLIFSTTYYYQVTCEDNLGTILSSSEESFTTSAESGGGSGTAPTISGLDITDITGSTALVTWTTNELSSGSVYYGVELFDENVVGEGLINSDIANFTTDHSVTLEGLLPNTKYILKVSSADAFGNSSFSAETEFTTEDASFFENVRSTIGEDFTSATITWITPIDTDSVVEFGTEVGKYPRSEENSKKTKEHSVTLKGLSEGASYVYRIKGTDGDGVTRVLGGIAFTVPLRPTISSIDVSERTPTTTTLNIRTNVPSTALVTLKKGDEDAGSQGTTILGTEQNIILRNLDPNSTYDAVVSVRSESGAERNEEYSFETEKDEKPPQVIDLKTESAIATGNRIQIAITFKTNEPAVSKLLYKKGMTGEEKEMLVSDVKTENHSLVTKDFESGATYFFRVKLEDVASNAGTSNEYAISTPKQKEDIIQIISKNLRGIFGWAIE